MRKVSLISISVATTEILADMSKDYSFWRTFVNKIAALAPCTVMADNFPDKLFNQNTYEKFLDMGIYEIRGSGWK